MNKTQFRKLATVGAAAALSLQLLAGIASAAVPTADASGFSYGSYAGNGYAGFQTTFTYLDGSTLSKLYLEADIAHGTSVVILEATKNSTSVNGCSASATPFGIKCLFKTVRYGDVFVVTFAVTGDGSTVSTLPLWSSTGYVTGSNQSHGDAWLGSDNDVALTSAFDSSNNVAAGFGNTSLETVVAGFGGNSQAARLQNLPAGKYASVNDDAGGTGTYPDVAISVNGGDPAAFQLLIIYPSGTNAPKSYTHTTGTSVETYYPCKRGESSACFTWNNKTSTATLYLLHNGTLRRG